ncbi:Smr/MutS family protein [Amphibiibacter pelophylacis]|uniref:Smr/MutS family protein n=1 Tax=Amphibiibacter pelophylacis TaxID=1799477 RepID=A0ACC6P262_9BURK
MGKRHPGMGEQETWQRIRSQIQRARPTAAAMVLPGRVPPPAPASAAVSAVPVTDAALFDRAVSDVLPLGPRHRNRAVHEPVRPVLRRTRQEHDASTALAQALRDGVDIATLLWTSDELSWSRPEIGPDVVVRLRKGDWAIRDQLDLHGLRQDEAHDALLLFLRRCWQMGHRCVRVIHGKGLGSPGRESVLKVRVRRWLAHHRHVLAFVQASAPQGGAGAVIVLLDG